MKCNKCEYEWIPRIESPKACPRCKSRQDNNKEQQEVKKDDGEKNVLSESNNFNFFDTYDR